MRGIKTLLNGGSNSSLEIDYGESMDEAARLTTYKNKIKSWREEIYSEIKNFARD
jgi:hypothetical protein